jgi:pimeloyl-ACP methyl ester carboxylesterase
MSEPQPFRIEIPQAVLDDLHGRLRQTRLPADLANEDWHYGTNVDYLRALIEHWLDCFDWREQERRMNALSHFRVAIDGIPIHYVHERGSGPNPLPLVLTHGWPWTFWDYKDVIGPLTDPAAYGGRAEDAFDVVVPSLPGFVFSTPLTRTGVNWHTTADLWVGLMDVLGYERFGAFGEDFGRGVSLQLGHKHATRMIGIHVCGSGRFPWFSPHERPWDLFGPLPAGLGERDHAAVLARQSRAASHVAVQVLDPQTLAIALHDSPAGLASWLIERRRAWSDCDGDVERRFTKDELLTHVVLYWATDSFVTSARFYAEAVANPWQPSHDRTPFIEAPTGVSIFLPDVPIPLSAEELARDCDLRFRREHARGGHFAPAEEPEAVVTDIRDFFRPLRASG